MLTNWSQHSDLHNLTVNLNTLSERVVSQGQQEIASMCVFSHVPKTGGTSLEGILNKNYAMADVLHINAPDFNQSPQILTIKKNPPKLLCGHHPLHGQLYQCLPDVPIFHCTMLRNPVSRVVSFYNYLKGKTDHPLHPMAKHKDLEDFLASNPSPEVNNGQARRFSGYLHTDPVDAVTMAEQAIQNLSKVFSLVMTTERFDACLLMLQQELNLSDVFYQRRNQSKRFVELDQLSTTTLDQIKAMNQADLRLHAWAEQQLEVLIKQHLKPGQVEQYHQRRSHWQALL